VIRFIEMDFGCGRASSIRLSTWIGHPSPTPPPMIMRRPVLNSVCAACRLTSQQQPLPNRVTRRHVQISATPSSTEPTQTLNPTNGGSNSSPSAGRIDLYKNHYPHVTETVLCRCALRSPEQPILSPLRLHFRLPELVHPQRHVGRLQWQA
jgi:hypothetical protein